MSQASPRLKIVQQSLEVGNQYIHPYKGYPLYKGHPLDHQNHTDPDGIYTPPTALVIGGLDLSSKDYDPEYHMRGFEVHGAQALSVVMVMFANGTIGRYDNITIEEGAGWVEVSNITISMILSRGSGTTASGIHPKF